MIVDPKNAETIAKLVNGNGRLRRDERIDYEKTRRNGGRNRPISRALAVMTHRPKNQKQEAFWRYLCNAKYSCVAAVEENYGWTEGRSADLWIDWFLYVVAQYEGEPTDIVLLTHRGYVANSLAKLLDRGVDVTLLGFIGWFDPRLFELTEEYSNCTVSDLEVDCHAVTLPGRWQELEAHRYPEQFAIRA